MRQKFIPILVITLLFLCSLSACYQPTTSSKENTDVALTLDNFRYYLTIHDEITESGSVAMGHFRYSTHKVYISGAIAGLYRDCNLYYKIGEDDTEHKVELNAAGSAEFSYSLANEQTFVFVRVEGVISQ